MKKHQFKPFDQVLVRDTDDSIWRAALYSHLCENPNYPHITINGEFKQCIPYNENTAHLLSTTENYQKPEPKEYHVWTSGTFNEWFTETEFESFIKTAVINNKDIKDFHVLYVKYND